MSASIPPPLRWLLSRASLPASHFPGKKKMQLDSTLATEVIRSLIVLQDHQTNANTNTSSYGIAPEFRHCFFEIAKRDPSLVGGALQRTLLDPANPQHGPRLLFLVDCLAGPLISEEVSWAGIVRQAELALTTGKWHPKDVRRILRGISMSGVYPPSLGPAAERYVAEKLAFVDNNELGTYAGILTSLPETRNSSLLKTLSDRATAAVGSPSMSLAALGSVCKSFLRAQYYDQKFVAKVAASINHIVSKSSSSNNNSSSTSSQLQQQQQQQQQTLPLSTAVSVFTLWSLTGFSLDGRIRTLDDEIAERDREAKLLKEQQKNINNNNKNDNNNGEEIENDDESNAPPHAFTALTRLIIEELPENDDLDLLILLLRGVGALRLRHWSSSDGVAKDLDDLLSAIAMQCQGFLELQGDSAISIDGLSNLLPKYFVCLRRRPNRLAPNENLEVAVQAFCTHIDGRVEELIASSASPPFFIVPHLLDHGTPCCRQTVVKILEEARIQDAPLPTLQTMRFLLECAESKTFTAPIARYLRKNFTFSAEGIPLVQLTTAMMCFSIAERLFPTPVDDDDAVEEKNTFIDDTLAALEKAANPVAMVSGGGINGSTTTTTSAPSIRWDLKCIMKLVSSLESIGLSSNTEQRGRMTLLFAKKMAPLVESAEVARHSKPDAIGCLSGFMGQISVVPDSVHKFLAATAADGADDSAIGPTKWMQVNDPANTILERTLEQQKVDALLTRLRLVPLEDSSDIQLLCKEYLTLFKHIHPDEVRFLFEIFADRTIKDDRILKDVMTVFIQSGCVKRVNIFTIASILNSCAQIRFAYIPLVKTMLASISEEQWSLIDAVELELLLVAMQRLSIRVAAILMTLGEKTLQLAPALTASQASALIAAYQQLGFHEEVVMAALVKRASECADNMSAITLSVLLAGPHAHRLPFSAETAAPIVRRLTELAPELAPHQRTRIVTTLKKTALPADLLAGATGTLNRLIAEGGNNNNNMKGNFGREQKNTQKMKQLEWSG